MDKEKQIEEMKREVNIALAYDCNRAKCLNCKFINEENCEPAIIADYLVNASYRKASEVINEFSEELIKRFNDLEYKANTPRKTIKVGELRAQMDWILHEVAVNTIKEFAEKYVEAMK